MTRHGAARGTQRPYENPIRYELRAGGASPDPTKN